MIGCCYYLTNDKKQKYIKSVVHTTNDKKQECIRSVLHRDKIIRDKKLYFLFFWLIINLIKIIKNSNLTITKTLHKTLIFKKTNFINL